MGSDSDVASEDFDENDDEQANYLARKRFSQLVETTEGRNKIHRNILA